MEKKDIEFKLKTCYVQHYTHIVRNIHIRITHVRVGKNNNYLLKYNECVMIL